MTFAEHIKGKNYTKDEIAIARKAWEAAAVTARTVVLEKSESLKDSTDPLVGKDCAEILLAQALVIQALIVESVGEV